MSDGAHTSLIDGDMLAGRKVIVTGASSGIGSAIAKRAVHMGAGVVAIARRSTQLQQACRDTGAMPVACDVTDDNAVRRAVEDAAAKMGGVDALVNSAGAMALGPIRAEEIQAWRTMFEVNVLGALIMTSHVLPYLEGERLADIINMGSLSGHRLQSPTSVVYSASKTALHRISEGLRAQLSGSAVRVVTVAPGTTVTPIGAETASTELRSALRAQQKHLGLDPGLVAQQVAWCLAQPAGVNIREISCSSIDQRD